MYTPPPKKRRDRSYDRGEYKQSHISSRSKEYREKDYREKDYHREKDFRDKEYREKDFREKEYREKDYREREFREKHYDGYSTKRYSRTPSPSMSRSMSKSHKRFYSPLADRNRNSKIHSRSKSPRTSMHLNKSSRQRSRSRSMSPRTSSLRKIDFKEKISDTSLFAELVKDKHKRDKALAEILVNQNEAANELLLNSGGQVQDSGENSLSNENYQISSIDVIDSTATPPVSNGVKNESNCMEIVDIPMPDAFTTTIEQSTNNLDGIQSTTAATVNSLGPEFCSTQIPTIGDEAPIPTVINSVTTMEMKPQPPPPPPAPPSQPPPTNDLNNVKNKITNNKPKSLTKLPMPPGVNVNDLEDVQSPSPPQTNSPVTKILHQKYVKSVPPPPLPQVVPTKKGLLNLPMPPVIPGSEDLSGDEDIGSPPRTSKITTPTTLTKRNRPRILNRRSSRTEFKEWGERCVEVFEVIAQIGEGTYGQVSFFLQHFYILGPNGLRFEIRFFKTLELKTAQKARGDLKKLCPTD